MKKFNAILAIATVALSAVFGFTSCDKADDDVFNQPKTEEPVPVQMHDEYLVVAATAEQMPYVDATFTLAMGSQTVQVNLSDMTEVTGAKRDAYISNVKELADAFSKDGEVKDVKFFEYNMGKMHGVRVTSTKYFMIAAQPDFEINMICGSAIVDDRGYIQGKSDIRLLKGVYDIEGIGHVIK